MRALIRCLDALLCRIYGVYPFNRDPECVLRIQLSQTRHPLALPESQINRGETILMIHLWNEQLPLIPPNGPTIAWAARFQRELIRSFRALAGSIRRDPHLAGVRALGGSFALLALEGNSGGVQLMHRLGFTIYPYQGPLGRFGEFWENLYAWLLLWTYNPASLHGRRLFHLRRSEVWMTAEDFLNRYGENSHRLVE